MFFAGFSLAQTFPTKPIRLITGWPPGTSIDGTSRALAPHMQRDLGQPIIVDSRPGANGFLGFNALKNSEPDGYSISCAWPVGLLPSLVKNNPVDAHDFTPLGDAWGSPNVFMVSATLPVQNMRELVAYVKPKPPGAVNAASSSSLTEMLLQVIKNATGWSLTHINYPGSTQIAAALITGETAVNINAYGPFSSQIQAGKIRVLFQTGRQKLADLPTVPFAQEAGVPALEGASSDLGFWGPKGIPRPIVDRLNHAVLYAVRQPESIELLRKLGLVPLGTSPEEQLKNYEVAFKFWADAARAANFVPQ